MPQTNITTWLEFALQQMAAESYLHGINRLDDQAVINRLIAGNNAPGVISPNPGATRFVDLANVINASQVTGSAQAFVNRYDIVDHHANDSTGFSATLIQERGTNNFTLSFRSTEYKNQADGGDYERDGANGLFLAGADGEILTKGFAFGQLAAMEQYYQSTVKTLLPPGAVLNVTGYSLGAHLATVFTEMHGFETNAAFSFGHTYTFNGPGRGTFNVALPSESAEAQRMREMVSKLTLVLLDPDAGLPTPRPPNDQLPFGYILARDAQQADPTFNPFAAGNTANIYNDARYLWAKEVVSAQFGPLSSALSDIPRTDGAFSLITQVVGHASHGDTEYVANSGNHAAETGVFIEDQPNFDNFGGFLGASGAFGTTHSITLIVDSLALQELFQAIAPTLQQGQIESILWASSNELATGTTIGTSGTAEAKPLEHALDALRDLFLPGPVTETAADPATGGFGNLANRNTFYTNIADVKAALAGGTVTIEPFVEMGMVAGQPRALPLVTADQVVAEAQQETDRGQAFRYAIKALNPFAVVGADYSGLGHASNGALTLFDPATGFGELTPQYLIDRAAFLEEKIEVNLLNDAKSSGNVHFKDFAPNGLEITTEVDLRVDQEFLFGSDGDEGIGVLVGGSKADHLYGGGGNDLLEGGDGRDYLQGDAGIDRLDGGEEADTMAGGGDSDFYIVDNIGDQVIEGFNNGTDRAESSVSFTLGANVEHLTLTGTADLNGIGNALNNDITGNGGINRLDGKGGTDHLIGGIGNDILAGGTGNNDLLEGGIGFDTYIYNAGDGIDQIEDSDAKGKIVFNGGLLQGGISTDGGATYVSLDGAETYVLSSGHLIVNGVLTVNADFQSGQFGIQLDDLSSYPTDTGVPTGPFAQTYNGTADSNHLIGNIPAVYGPIAIFAYEGNDLVAGDSTSDGNLFDGGPGDDLISNSSKQDYLLGGDGDDYAYVDSRDVFLGGNGNDVGYAFSVTDFVVVIRTPGQRYMDGGSGNELLVGGLEGDVLRGGADDDTLRGENIPAGWLARLSDVGVQPWQMVFQPEVVFSSTGGDDYLDGGDGNDLLVGDGGDDILSGGADDDRLFGDDEVGYLVVPGDDVLDGGAGDDLLAAGDGADSLSGGVGLDQLFGDKGVDVLDGGDDVDTLHGGDGADQIFGGAGDDLVFGDGLNNPSALSAAGGADFLDGGAGNDHLEGGIGDDTLFGGAGNDVLFGDEGGDSLFGDDGDDELQGGDGMDLLGGDAGDDRLFGQAGADTLYGDEGNDTLAGNDSNDSLVGGAGNDILEGGKGSDVLVGGAGHDAYNFSLGDGQDSITDRALAGEGNVIQFFSGITLGSLTFIQDQAQQTLTIQVAGGDSIRLLGFDPNTFNYVVNTLDFADGTVVALADQLPLPGGLIEGTENNNVIRTGSGDDTIFAGAGNDFVSAGAGNDSLIGGTGNDVLTGGTGQDTYIFNSGDGTDIVLDGPGEGNRLVFGPGMSASSVTVGLGVGDSLYVRTGVTGDAIRILANLEGGDSPSIDSLEFADGTTLSIGELFVRGIEIIGTMGSDTLNGTNLIDRISGGAGNDFIFGGLGADILRGEEGGDQLFGGDGDDLLDGGAGADVLWGGTGQDTYVFGRGFGQDILRDSPVTQSGPNTIQLTSDILPTDVRLQARRSEDGIDVVLTINGTEDELTLLGAADPSLLPISQILFADRTSWDTTEIMSRIEGLRVTASASGSFLEGTGFRDELIGAQGNDQLDGLGGADRMVGGAGDDHYWVNAAGDTVVELDGEGTDTVLSQINYTLPKHVEKLFLRTTNLPITDPVRGEGNASDNLLLGNFVNNVLIGGAGNDIFWGGFSIGSDYGPGDDDLYGGAGNDTYVVEGDFNGFDTVHDVALPGEGNRLQFGSSFRPDDVVFVQDGSSLRITNAGGEHGVVLVDFDSSGMTGSLVTEVVAFSGGYEDVTGGYETRLLALMNPTLGTDNDETVTGTSQAEVVKAQGGDDVIEGGAGNDVLLGGTGNDTYVFNQDDGFDLIDDQPGTGDINTVQFGAGITQDMLRVSYSGTFGTGGLTVRVGTSGDGLHFLGVPAEDPAGPHAVDTFHFADGTQLPFAQLFEREVLVQGTGRSDGEMFGTFADDRMLGLGGSEALSSGNGNDTLIGGPGNDVLAGGRGSDTYVFNPGDGIDTITEFTGPGTGNTIVFGPGITAGDLTLGLGSLLIRVGTGGDAIHLENFNPKNVLGGPHGIDTFRFADNTSLTYTQLIALGFDVPGTTGNDILIGTNVVDRLIGGVGNDRIEARAGNDVLDGGTGADQLLGEQGDDIYVVDNAGDVVTEQLNEGTDTLQSNISSTLGANLENLTLTGTAAITGMGNALDNVLMGNGGNNVLAGGVGADTLAGGGGDDAYVFNVGDGVDMITDTAMAGAGNRIQFGAGISQTDLTFTRDEAARTLTIQVGSSGTDQLLLANFDPTGANGSLVVETLAFADGTTASLAALLGLGGPVNHAPTGENLLPDQPVLEDTPFTVVVPSSTFADEDAGDVLTLSASLADGSPLPAWLSFDAVTATFSGTPDDAQVGTLDLRVTATDTGNLSVSDSFTLTVNNVNEAPIVAAPLTNQTVLEDTAFTFTVPGSTFADVDQVHGDTLTYSAGLSGGGSLPAWLSFDPITRTFGGTPSNSDVGTLAITVTATDQGNLNASTSFTLAIQNVNDAPTVANPVADQTTAEDSPFTMTIPSATFADEEAIHGDVLTYGATLADGSPLPAWLSFNPTTQTFSGMPGAGDAGSLQFAVTATDTGNLSATDLFTLAISGPLPQTVIGTAGNDVLIGGRGDDTLTGLAGYDTLQGGAGHDLLDGGTGTDTMQGGTGHDTYVLDSFFDVVTEAPDEGTDTVQSALLTYTLGANVEQLILTGTGPSAGFGNALNNGLTGNSGANLLDGKGGADTMTGGGGDDLYIVDHASDTVVEDLNEGTDTVVSGITHSLAANVENLTLIGFSAISGTGNGWDNVLNGLLNLAGNTLTGRAGNDTYVLGSGDLVVEAANGGTDTVQASFSYTLGSNVEHLTLTGTAAINGAGNSLNNTITGNSANNVLSSAGGADTLRGGQGNDTINGGGGNDIFQFGRGEGQDLVQDNGGTADKILYDAGINPLDLVISRRANDLRLTIHGSSDRITVQNWYTSSVNRTETIQAGNGQTLLSMQVDQLIQAMAGFTTTTGLSWGDAIEGGGTVQQQAQFQGILAANWQ